MWEAERGNAQKCLPIATLDYLQPLYGFKCDECKSFSCNDCSIVQQINKKMTDNGNNLGVLYGVASEIFEYKNDKKLFNKVELIKFLITFFYCFFCFFFVLIGMCVILI